ncbi:uncharacterized protein BKA55DRAFT_547872 [Fusarium redolens]|jgi:hypothetical protein|uniref:Uncharacterized protein n=1 Tax=Fusarium redolens TaxID=48865 RepID=A0A9P9KV95_FUSRE|nr:uncharacterized protein BKA55DRAFT_547872 [Fusarium redolens]KAH7269111.1 hypothetical protein BKA55DRAFT_547872 [Fusarium redolens]
MSTSDRIPLFPWVPAYAKGSEPGTCPSQTILHQFLTPAVTELQNITRDERILLPEGHTSDSQIHVPIPSDLAHVAGLNLDSTTEQNV